MIGVQPSELSRQRYAFHKGTSDKVNAIRANHDCEEQINCSFDSQLSVITIAFYSISLA